MKLTEDLKDMFICKRCSDATLKVKNQELSVHKAVLESRSRVFESMFEVDMKEKKTGVVEIVDCDPDVFRDFLIYLYSGKFENSTKKDFDMYRIADKYAVEELKSECVRSMLSNLCMDNLFDVVCLGHQFGEKELELKSQEFFNTKFSEIVPNDKWDSFLDEHSELAKKLLKNMAMNMREQKPL